MLSSIYLSIYLYIYIYIDYYKFPFVLKKDQLEAIYACLENGSRISVIYIAEELEKPRLLLNVQDALGVC